MVFTVGILEYFLIVFLIGFVRFVGCWRVQVDVKAVYCTSTDEGRGMGVEGRRNLSVGLGGW